MNRSLDKERYTANNKVELQMRKVEMQMVKGIRLLMTETQMRIRIRLIMNRNADKDRFKSRIGTQI
jgi:hypothetical protein